MSHVNAALTPLRRLQLARQIVEEQIDVAVVAALFLVSTVTARKWAVRYAAEGVAGMQDRSSRPASSPAKTPTPLVKRIVSLRLRKRVGPAEIAQMTGIPASTVHAVLVRVGLNRLGRIDKQLGEPPRRYEHDCPGSLIHVDVTSSPASPTAAGTGSWTGSKATATSGRRPAWRAARTASPALASRWDCLNNGGSGLV